jgi:Bacterial Ig-like domain (group 2)
METKFPFETDQPEFEVTLPVGRHVLELVVEDSAGLRSAPDTVVITVKKAEEISVTIKPSKVRLKAGATQQFISRVNGTDNQAVTWRVLEKSGGTVTTTGLYTAPDTDGTYHVRATSVADPTKSAQASVIVVGEIAYVTIDPPEVTLKANDKQQFKATIKTPMINPVVTWSVKESGGGTINSIDATTGEYTAPNVTTGTFHVVATSKTDPNKSGEATVTMKRVDLPIRPV